MSKSFLTRSFSNREKALIAVLVVLLLVAFYYFLVIRNVAQTQEANAIELEEVQMQIDVQNAVASARTSMQSELEELGTLENMPMVATYDNLRNELDELNAILSQASSCDLKFMTPEISGSTIRRVVNITYTTPSYDEALSIISQLQNGKYRCEISNFALTGKLLASG
ncbi:MAG: hypothetical protein RR672_09470, partial [Raoultibacter sp.]